jgi:hypothetical protein
VREAASSGLTRFLGVRLSEEESRLLDEFRHVRGIENRSDAVRALLRESSASGRPAAKLPPTVQQEILELVEDGWAHSEEGALTLLATLGMQELSRLHADKVPALRGAARSARDRHLTRKKADREGRGLLER